MSSMVIGNLSIMITFIFLGPIPPLTNLISPNLPLSVVAIAVQGLGSAATYIGSLLYMLRGVSNAGLPDTDQTKGKRLIFPSLYYHLLLTGMVSSLWVISDCIGGFLGDSAGSLAYDKVGFRSGTFIMATIMLVSVVSSCVYIIVPCKKHNTKLSSTDEEEKTKLLA